MAEFMKTLLWLSAAGAALGLILFAALRLCGGRLSRAFAYYMWLAVLLRLILPVASPLPSRIFLRQARRRQASLRLRRRRHPPPKRQPPRRRPRLRPPRPRRSPAPQRGGGGVRLSAVGRPVLGMGGGSGGERGLVRAVVREILQRADARGLRSL
jgi:hypothetical protein